MVIKATSSGSKRNGCESVQYSDQMVCKHCSVAYDVNDYNPPECTKLKAAFYEKAFKLLAERMVETEELVFCDERQTYYCPNTGNTIKEMVDGCNE